MELLVRLVLRKDFRPQIAPVVLMDIMPQETLVLGVQRDVKLVLYQAPIVHYVPNKTS